MRSLIVSGLLLFSSTIVNAQSADSASLLNEVRTKLSNHSATVSSILTDKKYIGIHPHTPFRKLIEENATAGVLQIATNEEPGKKIRVLVSVKDQAGNPISVDGLSLPNGFAWMVCSRFTTCAAI